MAVLINPESAETKEKVKWEMFPSALTVSASPGNPYRRGNDYGKPGAEYPKMLYRARQHPKTGKWFVSLEQPANFGFRDGNEWDRACKEVQSLNESCQKIVNDEDHELKLRGQGWRSTSDEALALHVREHESLGDGAAERAYTDAKMSDKAQAEAKAVEVEHFGHLPVIEAKPVKRRGRSRNQPAA